MSKSKRQQDIEALEIAFWDSMVQGEPKVATGLLAEPALMVSNQGANKFDHATYSKMANDGNFKLLDYTLSRFDVVFPTDDVAVATYHVSQDLEMKGEPMHMDSFDSTTWVRIDDAWKCVAHTESMQQPPA